MIACEYSHAPNSHENLYSSVKIHMFMKIHNFTSFHIRKSHDFTCENSYVINSHVNFTRVNSCGIFARVDKNEINLLKNKLHLQAIDSCCN